MFYHLDLWKIDSPEILERLSLETVLNPDAVIVIEWWSQVADYLKPLIKAHAMPYIHVQLAETESTDDTSRLISIQDTDA